MRHIRGADAERQRAERAMGCCVAVATDDRQARQGQPLFGSNNVDDALARVVEAEHLQLVVRGILGQLVDHPRDVRIGRASLALTGGHVMVGDREGQIGPRDLALARPQLVEGMERAFMHEVPVDPEQDVILILLQNIMAAPQLVEQGQRSAGCHLAPP